MIAKLLVAAGLLAAPVPAFAQSTLQTQPEVVFQNYPYVHRVDCKEGRGSAVQTDRGLLSVAHVASMTNCTIGGLPAQAQELDGANDFAVFASPLFVGHGFHVDCSGFKPNHWYWAIGYAWGRSFQTAVAIWSTAEGRDDDGQQIFQGNHTVIPGQSGGAVVDPDTNAIVGMVNAYNPFFKLSYSRALKDTSVCSKS